MVQKVKYFYLFEYYRKTNDGNGFWILSSLTQSLLQLSVTLAKPKPEPLYDNVFSLGVLSLQMQAVFTQKYYKPKRLQRHSSTLILFLLWHALPHAFDAVPFQSKTSHEFNIAAVYLGCGSRVFQM